MTWLQICDAFISDTPSLMNESVSSEPADHQETGVRRPGKRSRKSKQKNSGSGSKSDAKSKLERSRQSARECRARKKLRYQYLEDLVTQQEEAIIALQQEVSHYEDLCRKVDQKVLPVSALSSIAN